MIKKIIENLTRLERLEDIATARAMVSGKRAELWDVLKRAAIQA